ncbi:MAG TPA: hypothetical protein VL944_02650 [Candidatus Acidoferrum sp.]|nr:hypothetical protein [Candidatus Acidoferrum sp.]
MQLLVLRIVSLVAIALVYMIFDLFNKRNVPSLFAYGTIAYGLLLTILYFSIGTIALSLAIAGIVFGIGYLVYRFGMLGAGDVFELAALSLILPFQAIPIIGNTPQFGVPFVLSVFMGSGIIAMIAVPLYYIPRASKMHIPILKEIGQDEVVKAVLVGGGYFIFSVFLILSLGTGPYGAATLAVMMIGSITIVLFEKPITRSMVKKVGVVEFEEGDIIALNLMSRSSVNNFRRKLKYFDRLVTSNLITEMKKKKIRDKVPVYKQAIPFAAPIFIATVLSILIGNIIFMLLPL